MPVLRLCLAVCIWLAALAGAWAQDVLPVPALTGRVIDQTGTLSTAQQQALEAKLAAFEASAGTQIVVLLVPSTQPEDIAAYGQRVADTWKIGRRGVGDGLLLVVAKNDRRLRIEVAKALEGAIPDLAARQIIDRTITPAFKAGDFSAGINAGVDALMARVKGEALPAPQAPSGNRGGESPWQEGVMFFFVAVLVIGSILTRVLGRRLGSIVTSVGAGAAAWVTSSSLLLAIGAGVAALVMVGIVGLGALRRGVGRTGHGGPIIWGGGSGGGWGGGGGWDGGGGGGFGSGGGGDFGGGGASGDW